MSNEQAQLLNTVQLDTGHGAIGPFAGYHYQWFYFILCMLRMQDKGETVDFEFHDDVSADVNGHLTFYQLKHTVSKNKDGKSNLTLCDPDLWKSLYVWIEIVAKYEIKGITLDNIFSNADFHLVTNKQSDNNEFCIQVEKYKNNETSIEDIKAYITTIKDRLKDPEMKEGQEAKENKIKLYMDRVANSMCLPMLLKNLTFEYKTDEDILDDIRFQVGHRAVPKEHIENALKSIIGCVEVKLFPAVQDGKKISLSIDEFDILILSELSQYRGRKFIPKYNSPLNLTSSLSEQLFIKQLFAVKDLEEDDFERIRYITQQTIDYIESELASQANHTLSRIDLDSLYRNAYTFWYNKFNRHYAGINKESNEAICKAAANLLDDIRSKSDLKVGESELDVYLSNGLFYKMSDTAMQKGNNIGWHCNWKELFN